ncbi:hypothetical protein CCMA1212_006777 [Trichoderma ghanense]|uniref:Uncharacterized protein n=1 Tax=Trichoderma ghanense TaxID=65468 RepID=A0ABY2H0G7_9HYPO
MPLLRPHPVAHPLLGQPPRRLVALALGIARRRPARPRDDEGGDGLAQPLVGDAGDGHLLDAGQLEEAVLDLERVDVLAAADDEVLDAPRDLDEAVGVHLGLVARVEPRAAVGLVAPHLGGALRVAKVALHDEVARGGQLAALANGDDARGVAGVDDLDRRVRHGRADGGGALGKGVRGPGHAADGRRLRHAVADDQVLQAEAGEDGAHQGLGDAAAGDDALAQVLRHGQAAGVEGLEDGDEHGADAVEPRGLVLGGHADGGDGVKGRRREEDGGARRGRGHVAQHGAEAVEERRRDDDAVRGREAHAVGDEGAVVEDGRVRQLRRLGHRRRARRELNVDGVGRIQWCVRDDCPVRPLEEIIVGAQGGQVLEGKVDARVAGAVVQHDDAAQRGHGLALDGAAAEVADDGLEQRAVAAALARAVGEVGDGADDEDLGAEVGERGLDLVGVEAGVERDEDGAELEEGVRQGGELGAVAEGHGDAVPLADAERGQRRGEPVGDEVEAVVGQGGLAGRWSRRAGDDGGPVAVEGDDGGEVVGDGACVEGGLRRVSRGRCFVGEPSSTGTLATAAAAAPMALRAATRTAGLVRPSGLAHARVYIAIRVWWSLAKDVRETKQNRNAQRQKKTKEQEDG